MISLKYIKVWSGFPLMPVYLLISTKLFVFNVGAKRHAKPSSKAQKQKSEKQLEG